MAKEELIQAGGKITKLGRAGTVEHVEESFKLLVNAAHDYAVVAQQENTKRTAIVNDAKVKLERLSSQKELLHEYLDRTFKERRHTIDKMFEALDMGIEQGNDQLINSAMNSITEVVKSSPLEHAAEIVGALSDPNVESIEF